ncbi:MAG: hypothetical protein VX663_07045, partial [Pseudomonadota bacterium]|nr:hypothetical protein [Pseudomonadota bacterium]
MDPTGKPTSRRVRRVWWVVFGALVVVMVLLIALPLSVQFALTRALQQMGAERVEIHDVDLNLFTATFGVQSLSLSGPGGATASLGDLRVAWRWRSLLDRRLDLTAVEISGLTLPVSQHGTQWHLAGIELPASGQEEEEGLEWGLALRHLVLEQIDLPVELADSTQRLVIDRFVLSSLVSWAPESAGTGQVSGRINGTAFQLDSDLRLFADLPDSELRLSFEALSLEPFARLAGLEGLSGELSADTTVEIGQTPTGGLRVSHTGDISLRDALVPVAGDGQVRLGSGALAGALEFTAGDAGQMEITYTGDLSFGQGALSRPDAAHDTDATQPGISVALDA